MINQKYRKCKRCCSIGGKFITRKHKLKTGKVVHYIGNVCIVCANELSRERNRRLWNNPFYRKRKTEKNKEYRKKNREKIKEINRKYYLKNREKIAKRHLRNYEAKKRNPLKKGSHHRIPTNQKTYSKFNFRNPVRK